MLACTTAPLNKLLSFYIILSSFIFLEWCLLGSPPPPCPRPLQFSNVRLNMRARLVSSQALAAIYGTDEAQFAQNWQQQMSRQLFSFCEVCTKYFFTLAPNRARDKTFTSGHLAVLSQGCAAGVTTDFFHGLMEIHSEIAAFNNT